MKRLTHLAIGASLLLAVAACGDDDDAGDPTNAPAAPATDAAAPATDAAPPTSAAPTGTDAADTSNGGATTERATVEVAKHPKLGEHLVDADGRTLYLFERDQGTATACTGDCAEAWPPLAADQPVAGEGVQQDQLATAEGIVPNQVTYHGHLLYYFATDVEPGQIAGTQIPEWYAVDPNGEAIHLDDTAGEGGSESTGAGGY